MSKPAPLRVLLVAPSQGRFGGLEAFMLALGESLREAAEFEARLCFKLVRDAAFSEELRARCDAAGVDYVVVPRASLALYRNLRWADIIHAQNPSPDIALGARWLGRPLVMTIINHQSGARSLHTRLWSLAVRMADERCYISDFVRRTWEPAGLRRHSQVMPAVSSLPAAPMVNWERAGFFFIGRWIANKGLEELLEAYVTANLDRARWPLTLAGDGPLRPWVEEYLKRSQLAGVRLPGFISDGEKFLQMGRAKWNVAPPHTREDLGLTPIEARHLAVPSIITRDGGLPEAAGPEALVAAPGDVASLRARLEEAAAMPEEEYRRRALASHAQLREFLRPLSDYHALYRKLAKRP
jgi:glycosyltransferase involved in cell wall biosynthesis